MLEKTNDWRMIKIRPLGVIVTAIFTLSFMSMYNIFFGSVGSMVWKLLYYSRFAFTWAIFVYALFFCKKKPFYEGIRNRMYKVFLLIPAAFFSYSCIVWVLNQTKMPYITRGFSECLFKAIAYLGGISIAYLCGKKAWRYGMYSAVITFIAAIAVGVMKHKFFLELHEVLFVMGMYIVALISIDTGKNTKKHPWVAGSSIILFIIGGKRIGLAAVAVLAVFDWAYQKIKSPRKKDTLISVMQYGVVVLCFVYVYLSIKTTIVDIFDNLGISMMGRDIIYGYFAHFCKFSPAYFGRGIGFVTRQFDYVTVNDLYQMIDIKALHNDLMKIFIELGFIGFFAWILYLVKIIPAYLSKKINKGTSYAYFILILYAVITYLTDNTEGYFNFQMHLSLLTTLICMSGYENKMYTLNIKEGITL